MTQQSELNLQGIDFEEGYIAVIDKPLEWTSSDVVRKIKFALRRAGYPKIKVGHAGTLDPLATGILLVCIGKATKMADALQAEEKEYVADLMLGATTPSFDLEHPIDRTYPFEHITREAVEEVLRSLTGERLQTPPLYSAKKVEGAKVIGVDVDQAGVIANYAGVDGMTVTSAMKGLYPATYDTLTDVIVNGNWDKYVGKIATLGLVSGTDPEANYVQIPMGDGTQWSDSFTQDDYKAMVKDMFDGKITVSNNTSSDVSAADFATVITVDDQGSIKG